MRIRYGSTLAKLRKTKDVTQQAVAESLYVSRSCYASWEMDNHEIPLSKLLHLAIFYQLSILDIIRTLEIENNIQLISTSTTQPVHPAVFSQQEMGDLKQDLAEIKRLLVSNNALK